MKKSTKGGLIQDAIVILLMGIPLFYAFFAISWNYSSSSFLVTMGFALVIAIMNSLHDRKYKVNNPYTASKKKKLGKRILLGLLAGVHYIFFMGTYNHKYYNTQIWYPETFECIFGNISEVIIIDLYFFLNVLIIASLGFYYAIALAAILIILNIISLIIGRKKK